MNLNWIDWVIVAGLLSGLFWLTLATRKYVRSVADFLAAGRLGGRYVLCVATGIGGAISVIASWEMLYAAGLPTQWWSMMAIPVGLIMSLTGFIVYRFRQTRALTLAQFFEMRYSRRFRFFAGLLCWISGVLNFGIFPAVTARFLMYFLGFPAAFDVFGVGVSSYAVIMALYLGFALFIALSGGQVTIMITDFVQGLLVLVIAVVLMLFVMYQFGWWDIVAGIQLAPENQSLLNPLKTSQVSDFNFWYFIIAIVSGIYNARSWQGSSGFNAAAKTPHEAKMAGILGTWRGFAQGLAMLLIPLAAYAVLHHPKFAMIAQPILTDINLIADPQIRSQMTVPLFLTHVLPVGVMGLFAATILCAAIGTDNSYMHAWGTIFVQDVVLPLRKTPLSQEMHLLVLRLSIVGVAVFGFVFSLLFPLKDFILMFFALTGAIYLGGAGAVIIGGLYWNRGTTAAAYLALSLGSVLAFGGLLVQQVWAGHLAPWLIGLFPHSAWLAVHADKFPINGQMIYFYAMLAASVSYVAVSLIGPRQYFDMDRMLHRGKYAVAQDVVAAHSDGPPQRFRHRFMKAIGWTPEFTRGDRILFWATFWWSIGWWGIFVVGTLVSLVFHITDTDWAWFWWFKIWLSAVLGIGTTVWFLWGGWRDARQLVADLRAVVRDKQDDGTVTAAEAAHYTDSKKTDPASL